MLRLTPRQAQIIEALKSDRQAKEIAHNLGISLSTLKNHLSKLYDRQGVHTRLELLKKLEAAESC